MIVQEDVPYTKEEVKAMVKTIHDLREKLSLMGWHPASELPPLDKKKNSKPVIAICGIPDPLNYGRVLPRFSAVVGGVWTDKDIKWWCYPPKED